MKQHKNIYIYKKSDDEGTQKESYAAVLQFATMNIKKNKKTEKVREVKKQRR